MLLKSIIINIKHWGLHLADKKKFKSKADKTTEEEIQEFLAKGGVIQKIPMGVKGYTAVNVWGRRVKKPDTKTTSKTTKTKKKQ